MAATLSAAEHTAREHLRELEFPRLVSHANGTQSRVETIAEAEAALAKGATLVPTAPSQNDGGVPNHDQVVRVLGAVVAAEAGSLTLTSLEPATAVVGAADFDLHVMGTGFVQGSTIVFAGQDEPTTLVSELEVTTGVNMALWVGADPAIPVLVKNPSGLSSNTLTFAFTATAAAAAAVAADDDDNDDDDEPKPKARRR